MTAPTATRRSRFFQFSGIATISVFSVGILVLPAGTAGAEATAVGLGTAEPFAVLAGAGITNTGPTTLGGDIGTYPTPTITGVSDLTIAGTNHGGDAVSQGAKPDVLTAYNTLAGQGPTQPTGDDLTGRTLVSGVYNSGSSIALSGTVTLDAQGDPDAVFVFQAGSTLITSSSSTVALINGTQACNVFWQVGSSATLGTNSVFRGNLLALTDITATTEATVEGRLLAINGAVTLDTNTVTIPTCAPPVTTTTPTTTTTTVPPDTATTTTTTVVPPEVTTTTTVVPPEVTTTTTVVPPEVTTTTTVVPPEVTTTTTVVPPEVTTTTTWYTGGSDDHHTRAERHDYNHCGRTADHHDQPKHSVHTRDSRSPTTAGNTSHRSRDGNRPVSGADDVSFSNGYPDHSTGRPGIPECSSPSGAAGTTRVGRHR
ncbi:ice-binding family protein [Rhodococcus sp. MH15]|uniref:ice-binding family protein n=1 Tax=Rhodococcus sp. MH15 TaxID=1761014 RepID=UPI00211A614B|nr:ice-binding family protein [Rhodococcus sp. MH15]